MTGQPLPRQADRPRREGWMHRGRSHLINHKLLFMAIHLDWRETVAPCSGMRGLASGGQPCLACPGAGGRERVRPPAPPPPRSQD